MNSKIIIILGMVTLMFSCGHEPDNSPLVLDNGEKWTIVESMDVYLQEMEDLIVNFNGKTLLEHQGLAEEVKENIDFLTSNCTMKGQAHDELHKWLLPYIELVDNYSKADSDQAGNEYFEQMKSSFVNYNKFFK